MFHKFELFSIELLTIIVTLIPLSHYLIINETLFTVQFFPIQGEVFSMFTAWITVSRELEDSSSGVLQVQLFCS